MNANVKQLPGGSAPAGTLGNTPDPKNLAETIHRPAVQELRNEGANRGLNTSTHTVRAGDICPAQGTRAASGFVSSFA